MPMIELTVPEGAVDAHALVDELTRVLLKWEGVPDNPTADAISWGFVNEVAPGNHHVAHQVNGSGPAHYRVVATVPTGALNDEKKAGLVADVTRTILEREGSPVDVANASRVWVFVNEVPDGNWGGAGRIMRFKDIARLVGGDTSVMEEAQERLDAAAPAPA
jgi:phenylpyruvate tautomerase PptA (4-oxalocrotonate tautomerase family)